jgi:hypothetical protein
MNDLQMRATNSGHSVGYLDANYNQGLMTLLPVRSTCCS